MKTRLCSLAMLLMFALTSTSWAKDDPCLLTILLKHDQTKNLAEIQECLTRNTFYDIFPPMGTTVVDWHVVMGIGMMLVIESPQSMVGKVKNALARASVGAYTTDVMVTYNKYPKVVQQLANQKKKNLDDAPVPTGSMLMTFVLRPNHPPAVTADIVAAQKLYQNFPPPGSTVVNWYEAAGLGDIVVLEFPVDGLRAANLSLERFGWKAYSTDFYPTYDFYRVAVETFKLKNLAKKSL
jgi:hypothetical protein